MNKNKTWIITDTHFGHDKLVEYNSRPQNHSELILKNLKIVKKGDILIHLGDICFGKDNFWHDELNQILNGVTRFLCKGNHDKKTNHWYLNHGWNFVSNKFSSHYFNKYITFSHEPINGVKNLNIHGHFHNNLHRLLKGEYVVEGEKERNENILAILTNNHKLLAIEETDYKPVDIEELLKTYKILN